MRKSTVIVISPLNALMRDQIVKLKEGGLNVCVLKGDRVASTDGDEDDEVSVDLVFFLSLLVAGEVEEVGLSSSRLPLRANDRLLLRF